MSDYELLRDTIETKCASESFEKVDQCIERIISGKSEIEKVRKIKSLICQFEGNLNKANFYTVATIFFALTIVAISFTSMIADIDKNIILIEMLFFLVISIANCITIYSIKVMKNDYKDAFILRALNFKLDELIEENKRTEAESISNKKE